MIQARKCKIKTIEASVCNRFLAKYHIQGKDNGQYRYGLFYKNRLVSVMTFRKPQLALGQDSKADYMELSSFCTVSNFKVIYAAERLLNAFIKEHKPTKVISYADKRWSVGDLYNKLGFTFVHNTPISYAYTKDFMSREYRFKYAKHTLKEKFENFNPELTEWENMQANSYYRIWDCGNELYEKTTV